MNDQLPTNPSTNQPANSYVDSYQPPASSQPPVAPTAASTSDVSGSTTGSTAAAVPGQSATSVTPPTFTYTQPLSTYVSQPSTAVADSSSASNTPTMPTSTTSGDDYDRDLSSFTRLSVTPEVNQPATTSVTPEVVATPSSPSTSVSQALEDQNIFFLLGVSDGSDQEKEAFLDELQQVIWEDFLEKDVELLITEEEMVELKKILARKDLSETELQEEVIVYLNKLIPDLEEIMLEKALELKEDMVRERIAGMEEYYAGKTDALAKLAQAKQLIDDDQWRAAAEVLNAVV